MRWFYSEIINYKEFERMELLQLEASLCEKFDSTTGDYCQASAIRND